MHVWVVKSTINPVPSSQTLQIDAFKSAHTHTHTHSSGIRGNDVPLSG